MLLVGGCGGSSNPPGVDKDAVLLPPGDRIGVAQLGSGGDPETFEFETSGAIYVVESDTGKVRYSGPVGQNQQVLIYPTGVGVAGVVKTLAGKTLMERRVANFDVGRKYRVYVHPVLLGAGKRLFPASDAATPTTLRLVETRTFGNGVVLLRHRR